eukprot:Amastigsp_a508691_358.p3 type:complete len:224 gc:universal Amastigsp_a508691_358:230-901(+)
MISRRRSTTSRRSASSTMSPFGRAKKACGCSPWTRSSLPRRTFTRRSASSATTARFLRRTSTSSASSSSFSSPRRRSSTTTRGLVASAVRWAAPRTRAASSTMLRAAWRWPRLRAAVFGSSPASLILTQTTSSGSSASCGARPAAIFSCASRVTRSPFTTRRAAPPCRRPRSSCSTRASASRTSSSRSQRRTARLCTRSPRRQPVAARSKARSRPVSASSMPR